MNAGQEYLKRRKSAERLSGGTPRVSLGGHHWAAKCKLECAKEFGQKGIPLQLSLEDVQNKEMDELESFFGMDRTEFETKYRNVMNFATMAFMSTIKAPVSAEEAASKAKGLLWQKIHAKRLAKFEPVAEGSEVKPASAAAGQSATAVAQKSPTVELKLPLSMLASPQAGASSSSTASPSLGSALASPSSMMSPSSKAPTTPASAHSPAVGDQSARRTRGISLCDALTPVGASDHNLEASEEMPAQTRFGQNAKARIHRPVTPRELVDARPPAPLSIGDFPPIFRRTVERPQETHYCYFSRRIPEERPELRKVMELRANNAKRQFGWKELPSVEGEARIRASTEPFVSGSKASPDARGRSRTDHLVVPWTSTTDSTPSPRPPSRPTPAASPCPSVVMEHPGKSPGAIHRRSAEARLGAKR